MWVVHKAFLQLHAVHKWVVTGTPIHNSISGQCPWVVLCVPLADIAIFEDVRSYMSLIGVSVSGGDGGTRRSEVSPFVWSLVQWSVDRMGLPPPIIISFLLFLD